MQEKHLPSTACGSPWTDFKGNLILWGEIPPFDWEKVI